MEPPARYIVCATQSSTSTHLRRSYERSLTALNRKQKQILEDGPFPEVPNWFPGARLNYAENVLQRPHDGVVIIASGEDGQVRHYTSRELYYLVQQMAAALRANGLKVGDRVAGMCISLVQYAFIPSNAWTTAVVTNSIYAVVVALAVASIGGIFSSTATDMGAQVRSSPIAYVVRSFADIEQGILDRYSQIQPKFIFAETEVSYSGKLADLLPKVKQVVTELKNQGLQQAILLPSRVSGRELALPNVAGRFAAVSARYFEGGLIQNFTIARRCPPS